MEIKFTKSKRNLILMTVSISTFMATLDGSIVNIALPIISKSLSVDISSVQWIVTSYLLTISSLLLIWGKISDIYGRKYLFASGLAIFTIGSLFCGLSNSLNMLVFSRVVQAIGASITMALVQGIVTSIFPPNERGKALGIIGTVVAIGSLVGPSLGGALVHLSGWKAIFFINIPVGIIGVILTLTIIPKIHVKKENIKFDINGSILFIVSIVLLFVSLLSIQERIVKASVMIFLLLVSIILIYLFIEFEKKQKHPLIDLEIFKNRVFSTGLACAYISYVSMFCYTFFMPFYLQYILKFNILHAGIIMSLYPITTGLVAPLSGWLSDKITYKPLTIVGISINTIVFALLSNLNTSSSKFQISMLVVMLGIGSASFQSPNTSSIMGAVSKDKLGIAGSINAFFRNFGMVSGTSLSVILFMLVTKSGVSTISQGSIDSSIFLKGFKIVLLSASALSSIGVLISLMRTKQKTDNQIA